MLVLMMACLLDGLSICLSLCVWMVDKLTGGVFSLHYPHKWIEVMGNKLRHPPTCCPFITPSTLPKYLSMVLIDQPNPPPPVNQTKVPPVSCLKPFIWVTGCMRRVQILACHKEKNILSPASNCPFFVDRHPLPPVAVPPEDQYQPARLPTCTIQLRWKWPSMTCNFIPVFGEIGTLASPKKARGIIFFLLVDTKESIPDRPELELDWACKQTHTRG